MVGFSLSLALMYWFWELLGQGDSPRVLYWECVLYGRVRVVPKAVSSTRNFFVHSPFCIKLGTIGVLDLYLVVRTSKVLSLQFLYEIHFYVRGENRANKEWDHETVEAKLWRGRGDVVLLRRRQSTKEGNEGHGGTFPEGGGRRWSSSGGKGTQQSNIKPASTVRNVVAMTARATTKAARVTGAGSMRTTMTRAMSEPSPREEGDNGPPLAARVHNNQILSRHQRQGTRWWQQRGQWQRRQGQRWQGLRGRRWHRLRRWRRRRRCRLLSSSSSSSSFVCRLYLLSSHVSTLAHRISTF